MSKAMDMNPNTTKEVDQMRVVMKSSFLFEGYLPRASHLKDSPDYLPPFIDPQDWTLEAATFGQNDYIGKISLAQ